MPKLYLFLVFCLFIAPISAAKEPLTGFTDNNKQSSIVVDHSPWQYFLTHYLVFDDAGQSFFSYQQITANELVQLNQYIEGLTQIAPKSLNAQEEKAYWINLYNALTVKVVLDAYPVESIKEIDGRFGGLVATGPWAKQRITIAGVSLSLNNIEHDIVRPKYNDYRIHFALNCAAAGCPNLSNLAYTADNIEEQLDIAETTFINHARGIGFENNTLVLSSIFDWYLEDFASNEAELMELLIPKVNTDLRARLEGYRGKIKYDYDWSLNEAH